LYAMLASLVLLLARGLPSRSFFVGDPGLKLIAARNAIAHPARPIDIDLPRIGGQPVDLLDPAFRRHADHAHVTTSELFPLLSAPLIAVFGDRGAYVLPALGFLLFVWGVAAVGTTLDRRRSPVLLAACAALCSPLLFYGLEFWEHAPAAGIAAAATRLFVTRGSRACLFASGFLLGIAVLLRPEAAWYCLALLVASRWLPAAPRATQLLTALAGAALAYAPAAGAFLLHSGGVAGGHVMRNMTGLGQGWLGDRVLTLRLWLAPGNPWWATPWLLLAASGILAGERGGGRRAVQVAAAALAALAAVAAALRGFQAESIWAVAPAVALLFAPFEDSTIRHGHFPPSPVVSGDGRRFCAALALIFFALVALTAPNDGGSQWGPRYLLLAFIPLAVLTADAVAAVARRSRFEWIAVAIVLASSLVVQRSAYRDLLGTKRTYGRVVDFVEREVPAGGIIVTDAWWFQQVTAALYPTRVVLFVDNEASARHMVSVLAGVGHVWTIHSEAERPRHSLAEWLEAADFVVSDRSELPERALRLCELKRR